MTNAKPSTSPVLLGTVARGSIRGWFPTRNPFGFTPRWRPRNDVSSLVSRLNYNHTVSASYFLVKKQSAKASYPSSTNSNPHPHNVAIMTDKVTDHSVAGTAKDNIPTQSNTMDNIHGTTEDISNKASGYKVCRTTPPVLELCADVTLRPGCHIQPERQRQHQGGCEEEARESGWGGRFHEEQWKGRVDSRRVEMEKMQLGTYIDVGLGGTLA